MIWPDSLVRELAAQRCIVFLGAGASAGCVSGMGARPPNWEEFLTRLIDKMRRPDEQHTARQLVGEKKFLEAAEIIRADVNAPDFAQFCRDQLLNPRFLPSEVHRAVLRIDPKIVITTNYDQIYEDLCRQGDAADGYNVSRYYESHLVSDLRSPVRLIVKAHGCVSDPSQIVLTRSSYFEQRRDFAQFFRVLDALFLCSSILFIGYSLSDPDIQLVLENANIAAPRAHPHYAVISSNVHPALKSSWEKAYNIDFLTFDAGDYAQLNSDLSALAEAVDAYRESHSM